MVLLTTSKSLSTLLFLVLVTMSFTASAHRYPESSAYQKQRKAMVATLVERYMGPYLAIKDKRVIAAMGNVPRHLFVPWEQRGAAYRDSPVSIGYGQTISQPYIVALMTQLADITDDMTVLEVGTGSGYQAAILYELTRHVYTMEIISPLAKRTHQLFEQLGLNQIRYKHGDGYFGWPGDLKFDRILVTAAAAHIPVPLLAQLKPGGRMVIPVGPKWGYQQLLLIKKDPQGKSTTESLLPVRFVPLTGGK